jgi:hypothetical protein
MVERVADLPDGGWLAPGELRLFDADDSAAAKAWVAEAL